MTERQRQIAFLKSLLKDNSEECSRLRERINKAEHDEKCIRRALFLMVLVGIFSIVGLGYSAVLLPEFFDNATPFLVKIFCALGLGSLLCMIIFSACWLWYRAASNQISEDCRHFVAQSPRPAVEMPLVRSASQAAVIPAPKLYQIETSQDTSSEAQIIPFPRAS